MKKSPAIFESEGTRPAFRASRAVRAVFVAASLAIGALCLSNCGRDERPPDIILFTIDTLRADEFGSDPAHRGISATPFLDSLAPSGVSFTRCFAPRGQTHPSLASLLSGLYPSTHGLRRNGEPLSPAITPLAVHLKRAGYQTAAFCSSLDRTRFDFWLRGFDVAEDGTGGDFTAEARNPNGQREWDERVTQRAIRTIESLRPDQPLFLWVHLFDAHEPYTPDAGDAAGVVDTSYGGALRSSSLGEGVAKALRRFTLRENELTAADLDHVRSLYRASIRGCDRRLERIAEALRRAGRWDDSVRCVTADHGEDLGEHQRYFGHGNSIYDTSLRIPLLVLDPQRFQPSRCDALVQNLDLFPTLLERAGLPIPSDCEGISLEPLLTRRPGARGREFVIGEWEEHIRSISDGRFKLISNPLGLQPRNPPFDAQPGIGFPYRCRELYNVEADPLETTDLYRKGHPEALRLLSLLESFERARPNRSATGTATNPDSAALEALGYLGRREDLPRIVCGDDR